MKSLFFGIFGKEKIDFKFNINNFSVNDREIECVCKGKLILYFYRGLTDVEWFENEHYFCFFTGDFTKFNFSIIEKRNITELLNDILLNTSGIFSVLIYDKNKEKIVISNDIFGIYPLFYSLQDDTFLFSNEYQPLLNYSDKKKLNKRAIKHYFKYGFTLCEDTFLKQIKKVNTPILYVLKGSLNILSKPPIKFLEFATYEIWLEQLRESLKNAVDRLFNLHDHPSVTITGGLDSRLMLAITNENYRKNSKYFTFYLSPLNESNDKDVLLAKKIAHKYNLNHSVIEFTDSTTTLSEEYFSKVRLSSNDSIFTGQLGGELFNGFIFTKVIPMEIEAILKNKNIFTLVKHYSLFKDYAKKGKRSFYLDKLISSFFSFVYGGTDGIWAHPFYNTLHYFSPFVDTDILKIWYSIPDKFLIQNDGTLILDLYHTYYQEFIQFETNTKIPNMEQYGFKYYQKGLEPKKYKKDVREGLYEHIETLDGYKYVPKKYRNEKYKDKIIDFCYWYKYINVITKAMLILLFISLNINLMQAGKIIAKCT